MRCAVAAVVVLFAVVARGADDAPRVSGVLRGAPVTFPETGLADGVKAAVGLLESCHSESLYQADELQKALRGEHVRLVFARPVTAQVMGEKVETPELVLRLPLNAGVFWVRTGDTWRRYSKYEFPKEAPLASWLRQARPAD